MSAVGEIVACYSNLVLAPISYICTHIILISISNFQRSFYFCHFFCFVAVFLLIYHIVWLAQPCLANDFMDPSWVDPHAWTSETSDLPQPDNVCLKSTQCPPCEQAAKAEYFRLVQSLFNPNEFRVSTIYGPLNLAFCSQCEQFTY